MQLPILPQNNVTVATPGTDPMIDPETGKPRGRYAVVSLGCPKNLVDTEQMLGRLDADGYRMVDSVDGADFVVVNTCGFIDSARDESMAAIDEMLALKRDGKLRNVVVTGCLAERQQDKLLQARPDIDALVGVFGRNDIVSVVDELYSGLQEQRTIFKPAAVNPLSDAMRSAVTPRHFAYLKISEGCDRLCTFCAIPKMRGKHFSKPIEQIIDEAKRLGDSGVREVVIVAQDTTYYGMDRYGEPRLNQLLKELDKIESIDWIRLMYFYPMYIDDALIDTLASAKRIVPYIDMPLQHASDKMLKRMARKTTRSLQTDIVQKLRSRIDSLVMRTTMITGFPGETEEDFVELMDFVQESRFENLGVFTYSIEEDTPAARLPNRVDPEVAARRRDDLMELQQQIAFDWNDSRVGGTEEVLIDAEMPEQDNVFIGRTRSEAPDVDGLIYVSQVDPDSPVEVGQIRPCEIVASQGYDLVAAAT
ncbi:30S ribosomal protein S12 methylthiotransferase RimO [Rhodopirellula baltica]|uniref:Ribosomal protein uS12 methylthiotransferase RimO n=2 Tax=Rhodopirellula baltica TaxID=265606 RepID=F2AV24_RHOBT|nr:30S ribosomal protein S12 methylthiotransferase RimO [Rhodopirellula baltica]EGF26370.1 SSU ribosomal protein S12P methylthiotransferase [Rhodopirellula baltica WH47]EKK03782.1 SSU ribosomal protein S12P methylthiotransferase [Rhodopirellula baltica SH28]